MGYLLLSYISAKPVLPRARVPYSSQSINRSVNLSIKHSTTISKWVFSSVLKLFRVFILFCTCRGISRVLFDGMSEGVVGIRELSAWPRGISIYKIVTAAKIRSWNFPFSRWNGRPVGNSGHRVAPARRGHFHRFGSGASRGDHAEYDNWRSTEIRTGNRGENGVEQCHCPRDTAELCAVRRSGQWSGKTSGKHWLFLAGCENQRGPVTGARFCEQWRHGPAAPSVFDSFELWGYGSAGRGASGLCRRPSIGQSYGGGKYTPINQSIDQSKGKKLIIQSINQAVDE